MKKTTAMLLTTTLTAGLFGAVQNGYVTISNVTMSQPKGSSNVKVTYDLASYDSAGDAVTSGAYVTFDIRTNGVSIGRENLKTVTGDISRSLENLIAPGSHSFIWKAKSDWAGHLVTNASAYVVAYGSNQFQNIEGVYMKIDLQDGINATSYPVSYTLTGPVTKADGYTIDSSADKSRYLWLKRIEPDEFYMGSPEDEIGRTDSVNLNETRHKVRLTKPFFIGVFPLTHGQSLRIKQRVAASYQPVGDDAAAVYWSYNDVRGTKTVDGTTVNWPENDYVGTNSLMSTLRDRTGLLFDLPTEAQWEYACRAGTDSAFNDGSNLSPTNYWIDGVSHIVTNTQYDVHLAELGWFGGKEELGIGNKASAWYVGMKKPNQWGLYDCHGNVAEWCRDIAGAYDVSQDVAENPKGANTGSSRILRGGCAANNAAKDCRSAARASSGAVGNGWINYIGLRIMCPVE